MNDDDPDWGVLDELMGRVRARLQPGGPPVDQEQLFDLIAGDLPDDEARAASERVRTWESWHQEYWKLRAYMAEAEGNDELCTSLPDSEIPVEDTKLKSPRADGAVPSGSDSIIQGSPSSRRTHQRRSRPAMAIISLILLVGLGTYLMMRPTWVTQIRDGKSVVTLDNRGQVSGLPDLDEGLRSAVIRAISGQKLQPLASLPMMPGIRGSQVIPLSKSLLLQPVRTMVSNDHPKFRWEAIDDAKTYTIRIYDSENRLILESDPVTTTEWSPAEPFLRGAVLTWDVLVDADEGTAIIPEEGLRPAFRILSEVEFQRYQTQNVRLSESPLAFGTFLLNEGLLDEAKLQFEELQQENPDSEIPKHLIENLHSLRE